MRFFTRKGGYFEKLCYGSETLNINPEGLGEMFKIDSADTCAENISLVSMGLRGGSSVRRFRSEDPIGPAEFLSNFHKKGKLG